MLFLTGSYSIAIVPLQAGSPPAEWRTEHRLIDLHQHLDYKPEALARAIRVMDFAGVGVGVDLTPGTVTPGPSGAPSDFAQHRRLADKPVPL